MILDHIFLCVTKSAPEAEILKNFGLDEGSSNVHPGQGTANRRFFFENFMIELLFIENLEDLQSDLTKPTFL
ncbi:MAG: VOC family protein [Campylobacterales bacterium]|nr:VOC family protein [Campylobacterales bacterium]